MGFRPYLASLDVLSHSFAFRRTAYGDHRPVFVLLVYGRLVCKFDVCFFFSTPDVLHWVLRRGGEDHSFIPFARNNRTVATALRGGSNDRDEILFMLNAHKTSGVHLTMSLLAT